MHMFVIWSMHKAIYCGTTCHANMGSTKDKNGMDLIEAEDIKRGGKNTQKNCTKEIFTAQIITMVWSLT